MNTGAIVGSITVLVIAAMVAAAAKAITTMYKNSLQRRKQR